MSLVPSPPPVATATVTGLLTHLAQVVGGVKTFASAIIASAGVQLSALWNTNGTGASDVGVKIGVSTAAHANAKLVSVREQIGGGGEAEIAYFQKTLGLVVGSAQVQPSGLGYFPVATYSNQFRPASSNAPGQLNDSFGGGALGASDVATKLGTMTADASVNAAAKLLSVRTGLNATEVEKFFVRKTGQTVIDMGGVTNTHGLVIQNLGGGSGTGLALGFPGSVSLALGREDGTGAMVFTAANALASIFSTSSGAGRVDLASDSGAGASDIATKLGTRLAAGSVNDAAKLTSWRVGMTGAEVEKAALTASGRFDQSGTDSSGTPGAATINKPKGISAIAVGASSVVITNSLVTASSHITVTPYSRDATCKELKVTPSAGSFTVDGSANATAAVKFSWEVSSLL